MMVAVLAWTDRGLSVRTIVNFNVKLLCYFIVLLYPQTSLLEQSMESR